MPWARRWGSSPKPEHEAARRAALLAKADLTTAMVREFPELQGVMGGIYLQAQGDTWANVAAAVRWHYHPISLEPGSVPAAAFSGGDGTVFAAVSVADKLDTLAGYFGLGLVPTGSSDPLACGAPAKAPCGRSSTSGRSTWRNGSRACGPWPPAAVSGYGAALKRPPAEVRQDLEAFLLDRLRYLLSARGFPGDEIEAALARARARSAGRSHGVRGAPARPAPCALARRARTSSAWPRPSSAPGTSSPRTRRPCRSSRALFLEPRRA